jgi:hypothetical protein
MRTDPEPIEFIAPRAGAFGPSDVADFVGVDADANVDFGDDQPQSKWLAALAVVSVTGLLAGGVIAAAPWDASPDAAATTTTTTPVVTTAPLTTVRVPTIFEPDIEVPTSPIGYVFEDPGDLVFVGAYSNPLAGEADRGMRGQLGIWKTDDATRLSGRWFAVTTNPNSPDFEEVRPDAVRIDIDGHPALVSTIFDGVVHIISYPERDTPFELAGFGYTLDELLSIAETTRTPGEKIDLSGVDPILLEGLRNVVLRPTWGGIGPQLLTDSRASTQWATPDATGWVSIDWRPASTADFTIFNMLFPAAPFDSTASGTLRSWPFDATGIIAAREDGPRTVTVTAYGRSAGKITDLLASARLAGVAEWEQLVLDPPPFEPEFSTQPAMAQIGRGTFADGDWFAQLTPLTGNLLLSWTNSGWGGSVGPTLQGPTVHTFSSIARTFIVVTTRVPDPTTRFRITLSGQPPVEVDLIGVADTDVHAGAFAFSELLPYTVEFLDTDGNVVGAEP